MTLNYAIPVLPVTHMIQSLDFYRDQLGFTIVHHDNDFAIIRRNAVEIHLWETSDQSWRNRTEEPLVVTGTESFIAGTASCRIGVDHIDALHQEYAQHPVIHPNGTLSNKPWGTREFAVLDPDKNLLTFFEVLDLG